MPLPSSFSHFGRDYPLFIDNTINFPYNFSAIAREEALPPAVHSQEPVGINFFTLLDLCTPREGKLIVYVSLGPR